MILIRGGRREQDKVSHEHDRAPVCDSWTSNLLLRRSSLVLSKPVSKKKYKIQSGISQLPHSGRIFEQRQRHMPLPDSRIVARSTSIDTAGHYQGAYESGRNHRRVGFSSTARQLIKRACLMKLEVGILVREECRGSRSDECSQ